MIYESVAGSLASARSVESPKSAGIAYLALSLSRVMHWGCWECLLAVHCTTVSGGWVV